MKTIVETLKHALNVEDKNGITFGKVIEMAIGKKLDDANFSKAFDQTKKIGFHLNLIIMQMQLLLLMTINMILLKMANQNTIILMICIGMILLLTILNVLLKQRKNYLNSFKQYLINHVLM